METTAHSSPTSTLPSSALQCELWRRILARLHSGESLITLAHYQKAMETEYQTIVQIAPSAAVKSFLRQMILKVNRKYPELFVTSGIQNGISNAFESGVRRLKWDLAKIEAKGVPAIQRFSKNENVRDLLNEVRVKTDQINMPTCLQPAIGALNETQEEMLSLPVSSPLAPDLLFPDFSPPQTNSAETAPPVDDIDTEPASRRVGQQQQRRAELEKQEYQKVHTYLPAYVEQGFLSASEADLFAALHQVDQQELNRELKPPEADTRRDEILLAPGRKELAKKVRTAVGESVKYLQVFESLKKINPAYDSALHFLVQHKSAVTTEDTLEDRTPAVSALIDNPRLLDDILEIMERKDTEMRLLAVKLPPYSYISERWLEKLGNLTVEQEFVDDLRNLSVDEFAQYLNSPEEEIRARAAADLKSLVNLLDHVMQRTRFRKKVRLLKLSQALREYQEDLDDIYHTNTDMHTAQKKAKAFINRRLERLFSDLSRDERREMDQRCNAATNAIEQKLTAMRREAAQAQASIQLQSAEPESEDDGLTEAEKAQGAQIGRVEMRVAGRTRMVPQKIIADPDDADKFIIAMRDPDTDELVPQLRRGTKRHIERGREGYWKAV